MKDVAHTCLSGSAGSLSIGGIEMQKIKVPIALELFDAVHGREGK